MIKPFLRNLDKTITKPNSKFEIGQFVRSQQPLFNLELMKKPLIIHWGFGNIMDMQLPIGGVKEWYMNMI